VSNYRSIPTSIFSVDCLETFFGRQARCSSYRKKVIYKNVAQEYSNLMAVRKARKLNLKAVSRRQAPVYFNASWSSDALFTGSLAYQSCSESFASCLAGSFSSLF
jgi:hypothetical protein